MVRGAGDVSIRRWCNGPRRSPATAFRFDSSSLSMIKISSAFDAGAIEVVASNSCDDIRLNIRSDSNAEFRNGSIFAGMALAGLSRSPSRTPVDATD